MKILERLALILFSIIILILAIFSCLVVFNFIELDKIANYINEVIENTTVSRTILVIAGVCILLAVKSLFFPSTLPPSPSPISLSLAYSKTKRKACYSHWCTAPLPTAS